MRRDRFHDDDSNRAVSAMTIATASTLYDDLRPVTQFGTLGSALKELALVLAPDVGVRTRGRLLAKYGHRARSASHAPPTGYAGERGSDNHRDNNGNNNDCDDCDDSDDCDDNNDCADDDDDCN
ncbi:hypothetical protein EDB84DRAFT_1564528 [Lactarius hengduanensis]|nr:hypothetical protein EDB84DRAFT_1564528 [Lactarius hengduanensis]